ncbi:extracellular solute-binding protein [Streptomyces sp. DSM 42041]|uniref:Extracellular solute-binding protein n=1 Tax=Streptomyces hazeniae TaxID=3075538 RepID=A0ABU2P118_9ACTN|nr:extracellular solute-binding protein [Streptomyces sp. DSM 42041]MDT0381603.1 extracellular solute-binding protein [Streptomyces sp. DSM 42041]
MRPSALRLLSRPAAVLGLATALALTGCAPSTSSGGAEQGGDDRTGTLRVWLFREVDNAPKQRIVDDVVAGFEKQHDGVTVDVQYIPVDSRAEKMKGALNDPSSAPDVVEFGNTDTAGLVENGALLDVTDAFEEWDETADTDPTARQSVTVQGRVYGAPLFVGVRALYYRTDVFDDLGLEPPATLDELADTARRIRQERPQMYGIAVGGSYTYGALPFVWAHGGEVAEKRGGAWTATIDDAAARKGVTAYTDLFGPGNCPPATCAQMGGNDTVEAFANGKAGMVIGGDFNREAVGNSEVAGSYDVVPLPGVREGEIAPAFAGGNNLGVMRGTGHRGLAVDLMRRLAGKETQERLFAEMGFLPTFTDTRQQVAAEEPFVEPFVRTLDVGAKFVPATPAWSAIDASQVLPTMFQRVVSGKQDVPGATGAAARTMDEAFAR